jgi:hypothetical protein
VGLPVQLIERIDHIDCVSLVEIFTLCDADPFIKFVQIRVVKALSFLCAAGFYFVCSEWLSEKEREDIDFLGD